MFVLILLLLLVAQATFSLSLFSSDQLILICYAVVQLIAFFGGVIFLLRLVRNRDEAKMHRVFDAFAVVIASGVPVLFFLPFGIAFLLLSYELILYLGIVVSLLSLLAVFYGIFYGRWKWRVHYIDLFFEHLPEEAEGLRIIQLSDIHVGSFRKRYNKVAPAIQKINDLQADYLFFTGDLVNNSAVEMEGWETLFASIEVKRGKYSILGNHDYGDYITWKNESEKAQNLEELVRIHRQIGFVPLLNDAVELLSDFWLLGVENWGKPPFRQSGDLERTMSQVPNSAFKILLSHDPSHFDEQVKEKTAIELTLSGHTHGMQFGIERFGLKWSPVSFRYPKWAGLYQEKNQYLYVNRGFGYLGFPGRVGIYPEITCITLKKK